MLQNLLNMIWASATKMKLRKDRKDTLIYIEGYKKLRERRIVIELEVVKKGMSSLGIILAVALIRIFGK